MAKGSMGSKRSSKKPKTGAKSAPEKPVPSRSKHAAKPKAKASSKAAGAAKPAGTHHGHPAQESKKVPIVNKIAEQPRLLRETRTTTAALALLERGIKLIYRKEFKKARGELKALLEGYPAESEILARARSYLQICDREEAAHKKPVIGNDQLYTLGVMEHNRGDFDKAILLFRQSLEKNLGSDHIYYSLAASLAMKGDLAEAFRNLRKAAEMNEENRVYAKNDPDFASLHDQKEFGDLIGWNQSAGGGQP
jgi:tetratricopeptide (TPR) repeat protein